MTDKNKEEGMKMRYTFDGEVIWDNKKDRKVAEVWKGKYANDFKEREQLIGEMLMFANRRPQQEEGGGVKYFDKNGNELEVFANATARLKPDGTGNVERLQAQLADREATLNGLQRDHGEGIMSIIAEKEQAEKRVETLDKQIKSLQSQLVKDEMRKKLTEAQNEIEAQIQCREELEKKFSDAQFTIERMRKEKR